MSLNAEGSATISFVDVHSHDDGVMIVRGYSDRVALCLSLKHNGDVEAVLSKDVVLKLIEALRAAVT